MYMHAPVEPKKQARFKVLTRYVASSLAPAAATRRNLISNALNLVRVTKGRNLLISSGAFKALELRGPYDVANL